MVIRRLDPHNERYLICEGVENGLAVGDTFPFTPCFQDEAVRAAGERFASRLSGSMTRGVVSQHEVNTRRAAGHCQGPHMASPGSERCQ